MLSHSDVIMYIYGFVGFVDHWWSTHRKQYKLYSLVKGYHIYRDIQSNFKKWQLRGGRLVDLYFYINLFEKPSIYEMFGSKGAPYSIYTNLGGRNSKKFGQCKVHKLYRL